MLVMTTKTTKTTLVVAIAAAMILSVTGMDYVSGQESTTNRIAEPQDSPAKIIIQERADTLFAEQERAYAEGAPLKSKYDKRGMDAMTEQEVRDMKRIAKQLENIKLKIDRLNAESKALVTISDNDKDALRNAMDAIVDAEIPFTGMSSDWNNEVLAIGFETQELADQYAPQIDELTDVTFYTRVHSYSVLDGCASLTSNCDPLLGGVKITTEFAPNSPAGCSYSTAADRDVFWWTDYGFLTAAHCFQNNASGNDVWQPDENGGKIGDLNIWK